MAQQILDVINIINTVIGVLFFLFYAYQFFYIPWPWLKKVKPHKNEGIPHKIAVMICGRNEETVIPDLLRSLNNQTYDRSLMTVFVCADNCDDNTAAVSRAEGAVVYERFNKEQIGKGYALEFLLNNIHRDYPDGFDTYYIFDADNILRPDYIEKMNREFSDGYEIVTSYRNSKNYGQNWISAGMGLWFLRESKYLNHARKVLNTSCAVSGTGFGFSRKVLEEMGWTWPYFTLTEDIQFTIDHVTKGYKIGMAQDAEFFDEQPSKFKQSWRQRKRWARGYIQCYQKFGWKMFGLAFKSFANYDMCLVIMPAFILSILGMFVNIAALILGIITHAPASSLLATVGGLLGGAYGTMFVVGTITTITEWKRIHTSTFKKILYNFTFPIFMLTYIPNALSALFGKVAWQPIQHSVTAASVQEDLQLERKEEK